MTLILLDAESWNVKTISKPTVLLSQVAAFCINISLNTTHIHHFNYQLTHTTLKNVEILKHFKISKTAPTCFGLQGNHQQGATVST